MPDFIPTDEQLAIVEAAKTTTDNLLVDALAGAAKTSTLELLAHAIKGIPIMAVAFNTKIRDALKKRLPSHCETKTLNGLGHGAWAAQLGRRQLTVEPDKPRTIFKEFVEDLPRSDSRELWDRAGEVFQTFRLARQAGYVPKKYHEQGNSLCTQDEFYGTLEEEPDRLLIGVIEHMLEVSIRQAYQGLIDFDDQVYMPTLFGGVWPRFPLYLGDEVQDWSPLNHLMIAKCMGHGGPKPRRLIGVGDPNQSIYGFRGAMRSGMDHMEKEFSMRRMLLSISFRCPRSVIRNAHWRAPHMKWPEWAEEGKVETLETLHSASVPDGSVFICRNNAPLFAAAMRFLRSGRGVTILGSDIGPGLIKVLNSLGDQSIRQEEVLRRLAEWKREKEKKTRARAALEDRYASLVFFADQGPNLGAAIAYAKHLFDSRGPILFSTGHKSKGLEWDTVYHLDPHLVGMWARTENDIDQEANVRYVIETRAKRELYKIESERIIYDFTPKPEGTEPPPTSSAA